MNIIGFTVEETALGNGLKKSMLFYPNKTLLYRYPPLFQILQFLGSGFGKEDYLGISCYFLVTVSQDPIPNLQPTESCINWV